MAEITPSLHGPAVAAFGGFVAVLAPVAGFLATGLVDDAGGAVAVGEAWAEAAAATHDTRILTAVKRRNMIWRKAS
jgi:hypothetical protein